MSCQKIHYSVDLIDFLTEILGDAESMKLLM